MTIAISHAKRDAIYGYLLDRLSGIDDIYVAASNGRYEQADRLGREFSDGLRLIVDDLGWGDGPELEMIELTTPPDVLRRVFLRLGDAVAGERAARTSDWSENREEDMRNHQIGEICGGVLKMLKQDQGLR